MSLTKPPFGVKNSCEVAIIWPDLLNLIIFHHPGFPKKKTLWGVQIPTWQSEIFFLMKTRPQKRENSHEISSLPNSVWPKNRRNSPCRATQFMDIHGYIHPPLWRLNDFCSTKNGGPDFLKLSRVSHFLSFNGVFFLKTAAPKTAQQRHSWGDINQLWG